jgi:3-hydroxyisobutyrate dehydrogenase-like beta-hydroxyacid dehydrogenase
VLIASLGESLGLIEKAGLDRSAALKMLAETAARVVGMKQDMIEERKWDKHFALELMRKDIGQTIEAAREVEASMPVLLAAGETYDRALEQGKGALDFAAVTTVYEGQGEA